MKFCGCSCLNLTLTLTLTFAPHSCSPSPFLLRSALYLCYYTYTHTVSLLALSTLHKIIPTTHFDLHCTFSYYRHLFFFWHCYHCIKLFLCSAFIPAAFSLVRSRIYG